MQRILGIITDNGDVFSVQAAIDRKGAFTVASRECNDRRILRGAQTKELKLHYKSQFGAIEIKNSNQPSTDEARRVKTQKTAPFARGGFIDIFI